MKGVSQIDRKVKIIFMTNYAYDDQYFKEFEEFTLSLGDAIELVNNHIAVIDHIYVD